jgi:hypothetical protein
MHADLMREQKDVCALVDDVLALRGEQRTGFIDRCLVAGRDVA